jgi:hypothetical protein
MNLVSSVLYAPLFIGWICSSQCYKHHSRMDRFGLVTARLLQAQNNSNFFFLYLTHIVSVIGEHVLFTSSLYNPYINSNQHFI